LHQSKFLVIKGNNVRQSAISSYVPLAASLFKSIQVISL